MLYFTRWKALAIILTALIVCLFAVPNFFSQERVKTWPVWAQRHIVLGLDLQGGSYLLLELDTNYIKKERLDQVRDEARRVLREAKIGYTGLAVRGDAVEVRVKESDLQAALPKLRELSQPLGGLLKHLWRGQVQEAIAILEQYRPQAKNLEKLNELINYLKNRQAYIPNYRERRTQRQYIGSAHVEKGNDLIVARRQKHQGMHWSKQTSDALAALRTLLLNGGWDLYWQKHQVLPLAVQVST